jgi:hypothetical protein
MGMVNPVAMEFSGANVLAVRQHSSRPVAKQVLELVFPEKTDSELTRDGTGVFAIRGLSRQCLDFTTTTLPTDE